MHPCHKKGIVTFFDYDGDLRTIGITLAQSAITSIPPTVYSPYIAQSTVVAYSS